MSRRRKILRRFLRWLYSLSFFTRNSQYTKSLKYIREAIPIKRDDCEYSKWIYNRHCFHHSC